MPQHQDSSIRIGYQEEMKHGARIKVVGVGGGGNNAVNRMIDAGVEGVEFISMNTDLQPLQSSGAHVRLQLGTRLTRGLGTGANPEVGRRAALEDSEKIIEALDGADMVFVTAGLGGGTGTGAAPVIASLASQLGALTVAIVTRPFAFEGKRRMTQAERGVQELLEHADTLIVIPNEKLLAVARDAGFFESFQIADDILRQAVQSITDIITARGVINRDFADIRTTMAGMGYAVMGLARGMGPDRAAEAALAAITSPLLEAGAIDGARGVLINISGSSSLKLSEVSQASSIVQRAAHEDANIIFGAVLDERLGDEVKVTVIATGFREDTSARAERRLQMLNHVEQPTIFYDESSQRGTYAPIRTDIPARRESETDKSAEAAPGAVFAAETELPTIHELPATRAVRFDEAVVEEEVEREFTDAPELYFTNEWFDDDTVAKMDGTGYDSHEASLEASATPQEEPPTPPEVARLRQTAMAAYAASASIQQEDEKPAVSEPASFAEILASREKILESVSLDREDNVVPSEELLVDGKDERREQATLISSPLAQIPTYAGMKNRDEESGELDDLDIPAFLRRQP